MTAIDSSRDLDPKVFLYSRLALGGACAALADWLFYGHVVGLSFAIFLMVLAALTALANPLVAPRRQQGLALALLAAGLLRSIETLDLLSAAFGELSLAVFALLIASRERYGWRKRLPSRRSARSAPGSRRFWSPRSA